MDKDRLFDAEGMSRRRFLSVMGAAGVTLAGYAFVASAASDAELTAVKEIKPGEDVFAYISRVRGSFDQTLYQKVIGAANDFKEGDQAIGVGADDGAVRGEPGRPDVPTCRCKQDPARDFRLHKLHHDSSDHRWHKQHHRDERKDDQRLV